MMPCMCPPKQNPEPICCCCFPPKPSLCCCSSSKPPAYLACKNFNTNCTCNDYNYLQRQPPLRVMQKALVDKWMELEKLGQVAQMYWCQQRALQHQLACMQAKYCKLQTQNFSECEPKEQDRLMKYERSPRMLETNQISQYCRPENPSLYQGVLKIGRNDSMSNQLCRCNSPETETYRGTVRIHNQDERRETLQRPSFCGMEKILEGEWVRTKCVMKDLNLKLADARKNELEANERLQRLREELAALQAKIRSNWGHNALDKCTPAKENQMRFF